MYQQNYDPFGNAFLSTLVAAVPIGVLLYFIALHPHKDKDGHRHLGIAAPKAAFLGVIASFLVACIPFKMPIQAALGGFGLGVLSGFLGIIWIVVSAMLLYTMTVISGKFEIVKDSITHISFDRRIQVLLLAFSFGAIIEGTSGFGTPVAIAGAVMVGLGFSPFQAAVLNLLANTAPVAWGAIGSPITALAAASDIDTVTLSTMAGRQLPFVSVLVPFWLIATFVKMEGGTWKQVFEVWPAAIVSGVSFAVMQLFASSTAELHLMTDVVAGVFSVTCTALFLKFWKPKHRFLLKHERADGVKPAAPDEKYPHTLGATLHAWAPWAILIVCCASWGSKPVKEKLNTLLGANKMDSSAFGSHLGGTLTAPVWDVPGLHLKVQRMPPVAKLPKPGAAPEMEKGQFTFAYLSVPGTGVFVAALLAGLVLGLSAAQWRKAVMMTLKRMQTPVLVIAQVLGLGFLTRYSGTDAVLGLAFVHAGFMYPFFAAFLGWLGVFLTGSDTASNALFGSLQKITAQQLGLNQVLIVATNSTGGVMGKMIDAQSIMVACAATYEDPKERSHALGPIFRTVWWHSVAGAAVIGLIAMMQAYVFPWMIPAMPVIAGK